MYRLVRPKGVGAFGRRPLRRGVRTEKGRSEFDVIADGIEANSHQLIGGAGQKIPDLSLLAGLSKLL